MIVRPHLVLAIAIATALVGCATSPTGSTPASSRSVVSKAQQLNRLYDQFWEESLKLNPIQATFQGDPRYNDQLPNFLGADYRAQSHAFTAGWLKKIEAVGPSGLNGQDLISYEIFVHDAKSALEGEQFPSELIPINQFFNLANLAVMLGSGTGAQPFKTVQDYDNWSKRASQVPALFDQAIANMREGIAKGVVQPRVLMVKVVPQLNAVIKSKAEDTLFWMPVKTMPPSFSAADKARITADYRSMIDSQLMPAYKRLRDYIANDYMQHTRDSVGRNALPNGQAWYAYDARQNTTTNKPPAEIHQIGLDEVTRIHGEIRKVMQQVGFKGSLQDFFKFMRTDKRFSFKTEDALLSHFRDIEARVMTGVPNLFSLKPKAKFEIRPVEAYRAQSAAGGEYQGPSEDGSRPGIFYVNTYDLPSRRTWDAEDLFLHEAIPGHHFQIALQQELTGLPKFRRFGGETAFAEGWALYTESLGKELGMYSDPYDYFGYLQNELWRAIRLVVDTGLHAMGWTRVMAIDFFLAHTAQDRRNAEAEIDRYIATPGQATSYMVGRLEIQRLRRDAERRLAQRFSIQDFHDAVLANGMTPLDQLARTIDGWIERSAAR